MENVTQVMPATPWVAVYARTNPDGTDRREEVPLVGWALTNPRSVTKPGLHLVGMVAADRGVELVDASDESFVGYELPLRVMQQAQIADADTQATWEARTRTSAYEPDDEDDEPPPHIVIGY